MLHLILVLSQVFSLVYSSSVQLDLLMPNVSPKIPDSYLCRKFKLNDEPIYITEFEAKSTKEIAHHILLFACEEVGDEDVWNCGEMHIGKQKDVYKSGPVCKGAKQSIIFAWAMDAPKLVLPKDVAFKLGGNTDRKYLVMQVHYANVDNFIKGETDHSGLKLIGQTESVSNLAGVYLMSTGGYINSQETEHFETACEMTEDIVIHPFAYRTHAHKLGIVNSGYVVKHNKEGLLNEWTEIGRRSPQLPQMFFPSSNKVQVNKGDVLAARCTMKNFVDHTVYIGSTGNDEMCNFYIMYYVKGDKILDINNCMSYGPPYWYLRDFKDSNGNRLDLNKMPKDASLVPKEQEEEMSDMKNHHGMHGSMNINNQKNDEISNDINNDDVDDYSQIKKILKNNRLSDDLKASFLASLLNESDEKESSAEESLTNQADEYENYLNELENEYYLRKLLKKYNLN